MSGFAIRPATADDAPAIWGLVRELAEYEQLSHAVDGDAASLAAALGGPRPSVEALAAVADGGIVGYALFFATFSTFRARAGIWMEDLYVTPAWRGRGVGRALLAEVAAVADRRGCARLEWSVLDWNEPAIGFYRGLGAGLLDDWRICRIDGDALGRLARGDAGEPA